MQHFLLKNEILHVHVFYKLLAVCRGRKALVGNDSLNHRTKKNPGKTYSGKGNVFVGLTVKT